MRTPKANRLRVVGVTGTVILGVGSFTLSFTALNRLAASAGISAGLAWIWPMIVDGLIIVATISVVALAGRRTWYPWFLLVCAASLSVAANAVQAAITATAVPAWMAAGIAAVPPLMLLAVTHLTVLLGKPADEPEDGLSPGDGVFESVTPIRTTAQAAIGSNVGEESSPTFPTAAGDGRMSMRSDAVESTKPRRYVPVQTVPSNRGNRQGLITRPADTSDVTAENRPEVFPTSYFPAQESLGVLAGNSLRPSEIGGVTVARGGSESAPPLGVVPVNQRNHTDSRSPSGSPEPGGTSLSVTASEFVVMYLRSAGGAVPVSQVMAAGRGAGFSDSALKTGRRRCRPPVTSLDTDVGRVWCLADSTPTTPQRSSGLPAGSGGATRSLSPGNTSLLAQPAEHPQP